MNPLEWIGSAIGRIEIEPTGKIIIDNPAVEQALIFPITFLLLCIGVSLVIIALKKKK